MRTRAFLALGALASPLVLLLVARPALVPVPAEAAADWKYFGAATCGGSDCHGQERPGVQRPGNEYTTWTERDRHAKAFETLYNDLSSEMAEYLGIDDASASKRCLSCHSIDVPKQLQGDKFNIEDGVSCDACHGPAESWFEAHTKPHKYEELLKRGMVDTRDLWTRSVQCARCHASIDQELDDAGHPPLGFESFAAQVRMPAHWFERQTWDGVRAWSVGQAAGLRAALLSVREHIAAGRTITQIEELAIGARLLLPTFNAVLKVYGEGDEASLGANLAVVFEAESVTLEELAAACVRGVALAERVGRRLSRRDRFSRADVRRLLDEVIGAALRRERIDASEAEQVAGAVYALYNSLKEGEGPRLRGAVKRPEAIRRLLLRASSLQPEELFKDR